MSNSAKSFFERLTGSAINREEDENDLRGGEEEIKYIKNKETEIEKQETKTDWLNDEDEAQLTLDMYQTQTEVVIQTMVAGVKPEDVDVSINRDMLTVRGKRQKVREVSEEDYYYKELYWGGFSRSILLPQEIDPEKIEAGIKNGVLTIRLPKIIKDRIQKIKVKNE